MATKGTVSTKDAFAWVEKSNKKKASELTVDELLEIAREEIKNFYIENSFDPLSYIKSNGKTITHGDARRERDKGLPKT
jgi:hypothetical protein